MMMEALYKKVVIPGKAVIPAEVRALMKFRKILHYNRR